MINRAESATSQGDIAMQADNARRLFDVEGRGISIAVISDSYDRDPSETTAENDILTGDLPGIGNPHGYGTPVNVLREGSLDRAKDEGRAMLQIIHDIAPAAELMFHGVSSPEDMAEAIATLTEAGADIIVDDVGFVNEPFFQDGIVAQSVDRAAAAGVVYVSAAGNDGDRSYEDEFRNSGRTFTLDGIPYSAHDFDSGAGVDVFNRFRLNPGADLGTLSFQWDEPFGDAAGDLDIFIVTDDNLNTLSGDDVAAASTDDNIGANPLELLSFSNSTDSENFHILIGKRLDSGSEPERIKYINFGGSGREFEYGHDAATLFGHPNAAGAIAVGALSYHNTPEFGNSTPRVRSSSSVGGIPIYLDPLGDRLPSPEIRQKPDVVAPDGINTTFFGTDSILDDDSFPNFQGTSAAAPHVAGVAALLLEAAGGSGSLNPAQVRQILQGTALDAETEGWDNYSGAGFVRADAALQGLESEPIDSLTGELTPEIPSISPAPFADIPIGGSDSDRLLRNAEPVPPELSADLISGLPGGFIWPELPEVPEIAGPPDIWHEDPMFG
ncbi:S8 family serine peptidase [Lyngbya sp. CCY1209]|uniref:S8 family peptidase n=1 Tax=Lyngbya sp. CCY1209 TaxID=2886103 RepID=UPI002D20057E|nr:S8 family serine peptidase [Lyngbya sp. CCY1209]MEB3886860.1 S8 family serine peptidase [Lyngbya sp. CCY1209]